MQTHIRSYGGLISEESQSKSLFWLQPSTCVVSKPVQRTISAAPGLWSHVDLYKCTHSINNAVLSCVNYSIQGYANAHSAERVHRCYSKTRRDIDRSHRHAWPMHCDQHVLGCSLVSASADMKNVFFSQVKISLIGGT